MAAITDSPKPPASRITFTYPLINNARAVCVRVRAWRGLSPCSGGLVVLVNGVGGYGNCL